VAVIGAKGGVGTTTVAANLMAALAMRNYKCIGLEMRPYFGTLARHFGLNVTSSLNDLLEMTPRTITDKQIAPRLLTAAGVQVLVGPQQIKEYREPQAEQVEALLENLVNMAEYVVVDLPHMPSIASRATLRAAHTIVMVVDPEPSCVASALALIELLRAWTIAPPIIKFVIVNRTQVAQTISAAELERTLGCELLGTVTAAPDLSVVCLNQGIPLVAYAPTSLVAGTIQDVVGRLMAVKTVNVR
jgi:MinD-like ATPase involved in chromosome partitioning or flagellar assembly